MTKSAASVERASNITIPQDFFDDLNRLFHDDKRLGGFLKIVREGRIETIASMLSTEHKDVLQSYDFRAGQAAKAFQLGQPSADHLKLEADDLYRRVIVVRDLWFEANYMVAKLLADRKSKSSKS